MKTSGPAVRLCVEGELDIATVDALRAAVEQLRIHRRGTLLDLDEVAFIDAGSAAMLATTVSTRARPALGLRRRGHQRARAAGDEPH